MKNQLRYGLSILLVGGVLLCAQQTPPVSTPAATPARPSPAAASAVPDASGKYMLKEGEDVPLTFAQDLSSRTAADGDPVPFALAEDLKVGNIVVAKAGCHAFGEVTNAKKAGVMGKAGELSVRLEYVKVGETKIHLRGTKGNEGNSATTRPVALSALFGPIGLIKHGHDIEIKQGTPLKAYVSDDVALPPAS